ncbi:hypothetical protein [Neorhodopirellula pilleata]|nr:hypothetical protein [Neorhodopirellula pilleata]
MQLVRSFRAAATCLPKCRVLGSFACLLGFSAVLTASERTSARQTFRLTVPVTSNVAVPNVERDVEHLVEGSGEFPEHVWSLESNSPSGLVADFSVATAFTHQDYPSIQHDARLRVRIGNATGLGQWTATQQEDATDREAGDQRANVQVRSDAPGRAAVALQVSMMDEFHSLAQGRYSTTVVCTISMP